MFFLSLLQRRDNCDTVGMIVFVCPVVLSKFNRFQGFLMCEPVYKHETDSWCSLN